MPGHSDHPVQLTIPENLQDVIDPFLAEPCRGVTFMRIRRALGLVLREHAGYSYFVKVRASRADRIAGITRVHVRVGDEAVDITRVHVRVGDEAVDPIVQPA